MFTFKYLIEHAILNKYFLSSSNLEEKIVCIIVCTSATPVVTKQHFVAKEFGQ